MKELDLNKSEFKEFSLENFGFLLRDSASIPPDAFPYKVNISKNSHFFKDIYEGIYKGKRTTVKGSNKIIRRRGVAVEHEAILAVNDLGELMISKQVFEGNMLHSRTKLNNPKYLDYYKYLRQISLPPGWRNIGNIHSHPKNDINNEKYFRKHSLIPKNKDVPVTWSGGDYNCFIDMAKYGYRGETTFALINPTQLSFMIASEKTIDELGKYNGLMDDLKVRKYNLPPYKKFGDLGIILYSGIHKTKDRQIRLERLI